MRTLFEVLSNWGPMLLLIGAWFYLTKKSGGLKQSQYFDDIKVYFAEHLIETRRLNQNLERIAASLESRIAQDATEKPHQE